MAGRAGARVASAGPADQGNATVDGRQVPYLLKRSARARQIRLRITPDGVVHITVPLAQRLDSIQSVLGPKSGWIIKHLRQLDDLAAGQNTALVSGSTVPYLGRERRLTVLDPMPEPLVTLVDDTLFVAASNAGVEALRALLRSWYQERATELLTERVAKWARTMRLEYGRLTVRNQRTRWGSCSTKGNLNFNWKLVMAPLPVLDYVVIHELMHLREMNHSERFWSGVARHCPSYQEQSRWLRDHGQWLARVLEA